MSQKPWLSTPAGLKTGWNASEASYFIEPLRVCCETAVTNPFVFVCVKACQHCSPPLLVCLLLTFPARFDSVKWNRNRNTVINGWMELKAKSSGWTSWIICQRLPLPQLLLALSVDSNWTYVLMWVHTRRCWPIPPEVFKVEVSRNRLVVYCKTGLISGWSISLTHSSL